MMDAARATAATAREMGLFIELVVPFAYGSGVRYSACPALIASAPVAREWTMPLRESCHVPIDDLCVPLSLRLRRTTASSVRHERMPLSQLCLADVVVPDGNSPFLSRFANDRTGSDHSVR